MSFLIIVNQQRFSTLIARLSFSRIRFRFFETGADKYCGYNIWYGYCLFCSSNAQDNGRPLNNTKRGNQMKKLACVLTLAVAMATTVNAQIPNGGFETWEDYPDTGAECQQLNVYQKPDLWVGSLPHGCEYSFSIEKIMESYPAGTGQYSMRIHTDTASGVSGVASSYDGTDLVGDPWFPLPAFPISYRPDALCLYYKYFPAGNDTMGIVCRFYKNGIVMGYAWYASPQTVSTWTPLTIPASYDNSDTPDSASIFLLCFTNVNISNSVLYVDNVSFDSLVTTSEYSYRGTIPGKIKLGQNYPNPFNPTTTISFTLPAKSVVLLKVLDLTGKVVATLASEELSAGSYTRQWNAASMPSGVYMCRLQTGKYTETMELMLLR